MTLDHYHPNNAVAPFAPRTAVAPVANRTLVTLTEWAQAAKAAHEVAEVLVQTSFVPDAFRGKPYEATAAILSGDELGMSPMASLKAFDVIQGTAAPKAITQRALVQSKGHDIWLVEATDTRAVVRGKRAGSEHVQESVWTIQRAKGLGLLGKHNWKNQPQAMLVARATAECARLVASDALLGMAYSAEEILDGLAVDPAPEQAQESGRPERTAQRRSTKRTAKPAPAAAPAASAPSPSEPPLPGEDGFDETGPESEPEQDVEPESTAHEEPAVEDAPAEVDDPPATKAQNRHMHALFREAEVTDRDERLKLTGLLLDRELDTSKRLSVADASAVIDALVRMQESEQGLAGAVNDLLNMAALKEADDAAEGES